MNTQICYKLVTKELKSLISLSFVLDEKYIIQYEIGKFVSPNVEGSVIYCFESLESARRYKNCSELHNCSIFECIGVNCRKDEWLLPTLNLREMYKLWESNYLHSMIHRAKIENIIMCDQLKLMKLVS